MRLSADHLLSLSNTNLYMQEGKEKRKKVAQSALSLF